MKATIITRIGALAGAAAIVAGCSSMQDPQLGQGVIGGVGGAALGTAIGEAAAGTSGAVAGGLAGALAGGALGTFWNDLFGATKGTRSTVDQQQGAVRVTVPMDTCSKGSKGPSCVVDPESAGILQHLLTQMRNNPSLVVDISGFADNSGSASANDAYSLARATAVQNYLTENGISPDRIRHVTGRGSAAPIADNTTLEGRERNRRTEIYVRDSAAQSASQ
jgi:flagellar motor protein MotB